MSHFNFKSIWYSADNLDDLCRILQPGDLLEFDRGFFEHWGVCVEAKGTRKSIVIVHRVTDGSFAISSRSSRKSCHGKGDIVRESDIGYQLGNDTVRINNAKDSKYPPKPQEKIVQFALAAVSHGKDFGEYNVVTNNCEHFSFWCRNGVKRSGQVQEFAEGVLVTLAVTAIVGGTAAAIYNYSSKSDKRSNQKTAIVGKQNNGNKMWS